MFSIVIPTLKKNIKVLNMLLQQLVEDDCIAEIILIDNTTNGFEYPNEKVKVIVPKKNQYVNPAWNLGVLNSSCDYIGLVNDDLIFPKNFFVQILGYLEKNKNIGYMGLEPIDKTEENAFNDYPQERKLYFDFVEKRSLSFGSAMFFRKENYYKIPEKLKVFCGDDFLFYKALENGYKNVKICNSGVLHLHALTSSLKSFDKIKYNDQVLYSQMNPNYVFCDRDVFSFVERIFSISHSYDKKHIKICFLGLKIKFKRKF